MSLPLHIEASGPEHTGFLVIDSLVNRTSSGGVRITPDLQRQEIQDLAREMSLKYAWCRLPRGGAKAGLRLASDLPAPARRAALETFGRQLAPILQTGLYYPGMDLGCGPEDLRAIYRGAGFSLGTPTDTSLFTAITVAASVLAWADTAPGPGRWSLAIEGFGSVATHLIRALPEDRFRVVALATAQGAVAQEAGWTREELLAARSAHKDALVEHLPGHRLPKEDVSRIPADVFLPSARTRSLTAELARALPARAVLPIANAPFGEGALDVLASRGLAVLPGYVVNCGGVFASSLFDSGLSETTIRGLFSAHYRPILRGLLEVCARRGLSGALSMDEIAAGHAATRSANSSGPDRVARVLALAKRRLPRSARARAAQSRALAAFEGMRRDVAGLEAS